MVFLVTISGSPSPDEFDGFLDDITQWLSAIRTTGERISLIVDPSQLTRFDAHMRRSYGQWRGEQRALIRETCSKAAYVTHDAMWRGIMTAVFWFAKPAIPVELCASRELALDWLRAGADAPSDPAPGGLPPAGDRF